MPIRHFRSRVLRFVTSGRGPQLVGLGAIVALAVLGAALIANVRNATKQHDQAEAWHVHTLDVLLVAEQLNVALQSAIRGERGFLLTGDVRFLAPYEAGRRQAGPLVTRLRELVRDNPRQQAKLAALEKQVTSYFEVIGRATALARAGDRAGALAIVQSGEDRRHMVMLEAALHAIEAEERQLLQLRRAKAEVTGRRTERLGRALTLLSVLLLGLAAAAGVAALRAHAQVRKTAKELRASEARYRLVFNTVGEVIFQTDAKGRWMVLNPAWAQVSGHPVESSIGRSFLGFVHEDDRMPLLQAFETLAARKIDECRQSLRFRKTDGSIRWAEARVRLLVDPNDDIVGSAGTLRDITDRVMLENELRSARDAAECAAADFYRLATTDDLTGLFNRRHFLARLDDELVRRRRQKTPLSLALLDIDHFKRINDTHGHAAGDEVLRTVARTLGKATRAVDIVGRIGGEEFAIILPDTDLVTAEAVCERLREAIAARRIAMPSGIVTFATASIGLALHAALENGSDIMCRADVALYAAKEKGRNRVQLAA